VCTISKDKEVIILKGVNFPETCEVCGWEHGFTSRSERDFDGYTDDKNRIVDEIYECHNCHTLYRARWVMAKFSRLFETVGEIEPGKYKTTGKVQ